MQTITYTLSDKYIRCLFLDKLKDLNVEYKPQGKDLDK